MSLLTRDYDFVLPPELIARYPLPERTASRMLVLRREEGTIEHRLFADFPSYLTKGDLVVLNDTRVIPARIFSDDGSVEMLLIEMVEENTWKCMVKPGRRMRVGAVVRAAGVGGAVTRILPGGERVVTFEGPLDLERHGEIPLPPYLERGADAADAERYQTVYARAHGAIAAPTAGLHFTPEILAEIPHAFLTLHVGPGTFRPVQAEDLSRHEMHSERYELPEGTAAAMREAARVIAIGTTTTRVLESRAALGLPVTSGAGETGIFIHPPYRFQVVDGLLTNFHLPRSTLLMLVAAFAGREFILRAYAEAIRERYRFYSYGDCMLIL